LDSYRIQGTDRELVNAVFYKSSAASERVKAFIDFIKPKLTLWLTLALFISLSLRRLYKVKVYIKAKRSANLVQSGLNLLYRVNH
jgi:hypothetical protein